MDRIILHADMDAFFASVEQVLHPEYCGKPLIISGSEARGVVSTASYEARKYGVHSAMPLWQARRLCPHGIYVPVNGPACQEASRQALQIYQRYTPCLDAISIDEACLDITGSQKLFGTPETIAREIQSLIRQNLGLSVSIGIGPNRLIAKMASDWKKPGGLTIVTPEQLPDILAPLPIGKLWGLGPATQKHLALFGIRTIGQLQALPLSFLERELGRTGQHLYYAARGNGSSLVTVYDGQHEFKQMSEETTFAQDTRDIEFLCLILLKLCDNVARRLRRKGYQARTISIKIRMEDFTTFTRGTTLKEPTDTEDIIYQEAQKLLRAYPLGVRRVRLLGMAASNLIYERPVKQLSLFGENPNRYRQLCRARDKIRDRFGKHALERASLLHSPS